MAADPSQALHQRYASAVRQQGYQPSAAQLAAVDRLEALRSALLERATHSWRRRWRRWLPAPQADAAHGLYLWGEVGRGKTWLVDLFFDCLPFADKRRAHFHHFMADVHTELHRLRAEQNPLQSVARRLARRMRVLCLDELQVSDIGDAMLLHGLFSALLDAGVMLVITSNRPPSDLYKDGLQRARFLPAIALLQSELEVFQLLGDSDYRLRQLQSAPVYFLGAPGDCDDSLAGVFERMAGKGRAEDPLLILKGRRVMARRRAADVVWFDFQTLCQGARSQEDYVQLAAGYHTVLLSGIPVLDSDQDDAVRRLIALVDEFYDQGVKLIACAAAAPADLYHGERLRFEFERTASRLVEMQSVEYLARPHGR